MRHRNANLFSRGGHCERPTVRETGKVWHLRSRRSRPGDARPAQRYSRGFCPEEIASSDQASRSHATCNQIAVPKIDRVAKRGGTDEWPEHRARVVQAGYRRQIRAGEMVGDYFVTAPRNKPDYHVERERARPTCVPPQK